MKEFNAEKFCSDLIILRGKETQDTFVKRKLLRHHRGICN